MDDVNPRQADYPVDPLFLNRWSPRAFTGEAIPEAELMTLFEAARWAPSSYNSQPWRFLYARRDTPQFEKFLGFLGEFNQSWAKHAAALIVLVSSSTMVPPGLDSPVPSHSHSMDAGAAWENLALQALISGWHVHGMVGFDMEKAFSELKVPQGFRLEQMIAVGRRGDKAMLPEALAGREAPNDRKPVSQFAFEGDFPA